MVIMGQNRLFLPILRKLLIFAILNESKTIGTLPVNIIGDWVSSGFHKSIDINSVKWLQSPLT